MEEGGGGGGQVFDYAMGRGSSVGLGFYGDSGDAVVPAYYQGCVVSPYKSTFI